MKKHLKAAFAVILAALMALAAVPVSALPRFEAETPKAEIEPYWTVPEGYNEHDYNKCVAFLEQTDENGVKNGSKLSSSYNPNNPNTWGSTYTYPRQNSVEKRFKWRDIGGEKRLEHVLACQYPYDINYNCGDNKAISAKGDEYIPPEINLTGAFDFSDCTELVWIDLNSHTNAAGMAISSVDVSGCSALIFLDCSRNKLSFVSLIGCSSLTYLDVSYNQLTMLDINTCVELDSLYCLRNQIRELDLSNNRNLTYRCVAVEGNGYTGYSDYIYIPIEGIRPRSVTCFAYPVGNSTFDGFYDENGDFISEGEWSGWYEAYIYEFVSNTIPTGTIIARFSGGALPGDLDGSGSVTTADAITTLRLAMQLLDGSGLNTDAADMDGNGSVTLADAILILRTAMGLA